MAFRSIAPSLVNPLVLCALLVVGARTASAQITFSEQNFAPGSFLVTAVNGGGGGGASQVVVAVGNPGPSLQITHTLAAGSPSGNFCARWEWTFFTMTGAMVNPAILGGVASIDFSLDSAWIGSAPLTGMPQSQAAVIVQNGRMYISMRPPGVIGGSGAWSTTNMNALLPGEFAEVVNLPPCVFTDSSQHLDFSPIGAPIQLGFARGNSTSFGGNGSDSIITHAADNWTMTVHPCGLTLSQQPVSTATCRSGSAVFSVVATGTSPSFQWQVESLPQGSGVWTDLANGPFFRNGVQLATAEGSGTATLRYTMFTTDGVPIRNRCLITNLCSSVTSNIATLTVCIADFNCDGSLDFFDYLDFVDALSAQLPAADFNSDGVIDFFDYLDFVDAFSIGC